MAKTMEELRREMHEKYGRKEKEKNTFSPPVAVSEETKKENTSRMDELRKEMNEKYNLVSKVNDKFISDFNTDVDRLFKKSQSTYDGITWGTAASTYDAQAKTIADLRARSGAIRQYLKKNKDSIDPEEYESLLSNLDSIGEGMNSYLDTFSKAKKHYGQWKTEDEYNGWLDYQDSLDFDLEAGKAEIDRLQGYAETWEDAVSQISILETSISRKEHDLQYGLFVDKDKLSKEIAEEKARLESYRSVVNQIDGAKVIEDLEDKKAYYALAEKNQQAYEYLLLANAGDFAEKSKYVSTYRGGEEYNAWSNMYTDTGYDDIMYDYINGDEKARSIKGLNDTQSNATLVGVDKGERKEMTPEEISIFNYIYSTEGREAAYEYVEFLTEDLNARQRATTMEKWAKMAEEDPVGSSVFSVIEAPLKGISYIGQAADYLDDGKIDQNAGYNKFSYVNSAIRNQVTKTVEDKWGGVGSFAYQTGMSMADFLFSTAITGGNSALSLGIMGTGAAADTVISAKDRGLSDDQAFALGTIAGAAEVITEKISLDALLDATQLGKSALGYVIKNVFAEGSEEVGSSLINLVADVLISKDKSEWQMAIDEYKANGMSDKEAFWHTVGDQALSLGLDFLGGAISGGVMGGGGVAINSGLNAIQKNQAIKEHGQAIIDNGGTDYLRELALEVAGVNKDSQGKKLENLAGKVEKKASAKNVGKLSVKMEDTITKQNRTDIQTALTEKGLSEKDAKRVSEYLGGTSKLTTEQKAEIEGNESIKAVVTELLEDPKSTISERGRNLLGARLGVDVKNAKLNASSSGDISLRNDVDVKDRVSESGKTTITTMDENGKSIDVEATIDKKNPIAKVEYVKGDDGNVVDRIVYFNTDHGKVKSTDVMYASEAEGLLYEAFVDMNPAFANAVIRNYDGSVPIQTYIHGMREGMILYGMHNFQAVGTDISKNSFLASLSEADQAFALKLGRAYAKADAKKANADLHRAIKNAAEKAKASEGATTSEVTQNKPKKGNVRFENGAKAEGKHKKVVTLAKHLASAIGIDIVFYDSRTTPKEAGKGANGYFDGDTDTIYLDLQKADTDAKTIAFTLSHELVHFIKKWSPQKYNKFAEFLMDQYAAHGVSASTLLKQKMVELNTNDADLAYEEMICDACETMLLDSNAVVKLMELRKSDLELFEKIKLHILKILNDIHEAYKKLGYEPSSDEAKALLNMKDVLEKFYTLFEEAAVDAAQTYQATQILNTDSVSVSEDGTVKMQMKQYQQTGRSTLLNYLTEQYGKDNAYDLISTIDNIYNTLAEVKKDEAFSVFSNWQDTEIELDENGHPIFTTSINNGDYELNQDFSRVCKKRRQLDFVLNMLAEDPAFEASHLTKQDFVKINQAIKNHGFEIACALCFVDSKRFRQAEWADSFANTWNDILNAVVKDSSKLTPFNFATKNPNLADDGIEIDTSKAVTYRKWSDGKEDVKNRRTYESFEQMLSKGNDGKWLEGNTNVRTIATLIRDNPELRHTFRGADIIGSKGFDTIQRLAPGIRSILDGWGGSSVPKPSSNDASYDSSIINVSGYNKKTAYAMGGVRMNSFSDFMAHMFFDYCQAFADLSAKELPSQAYTKELIYVRLFGRSGQKINMSGIAAIRDDALPTTAGKGVTKAEAEANEKIEKMVAGLDVTRLLEYLNKDIHQLTEEDVEQFLDMCDYVWADESINMKHATLLQTGILYDKLSESKIEECYELLKAGEIEQALKVAGEENVDAEYAKNCGTIVVGVSDAHIRKLLRDPTVRMVIPYHKSGLNPIIARELRISAYNDYTLTQTTGVKRKGTKTTDKIGSTAIKDAYGLKDFAFYDWFGKTIDGKLYDGKATADKYLEWCEKGYYDEKVGDYVYYTTKGDGYILAKDFHKKASIVPKFDAFSGEENYYKVLEDFDCYNTISGEHSAQGAVDFFHNGLPSDYKTVLMDALKEEQKVHDDFRDHLDNKGLKDEVMDIVKARGYEPSIKKQEKKQDVSEKGLSYNSLIALPNMVGTTLDSSTQVKLTADGKIDEDWLFERLFAQCKSVETNAPLPSYYLYSEALGTNIEIIKKSIRHGYISSSSHNKPANPKEIENARAALNLHDIIRTAIVVNLTEKYKTYDSPFAYVMMGVTRMDDPQGGIGYYAVRLVVQDRKKGGAVLQEANVLGLLNAVNAKKIDLPNPQVGSERTVALLSGGQFEYSIAHLLDDVKSIFPDTFSKDVYNHFNMQRKDSKTLSPLRYQLKKTSSDSQYVPTFYSQMGREIDAIKMDKIGASSLIPYLKGKGIKHDEIKWSGIEAFLEGKKSVTKAELQEFVAGSQLEIEETIIDNTETPMSKELRDNIAALERERNNLVNKVKSEWKRILGTDELDNYAGESIPYDFDIRLSTAVVSKKMATPIGQEYKAAQEAMKEVCEESDYFGYDNAKQAYVAALRNPVSFLHGNELTATEEAAVRRLALAKQAWLEFEGVVPASDVQYLKDLGEDVRRIDGKITAIRTEHRGEQKLPRWGSYKLKGGENYREIVFKMTGSDYTNYAMDTHWGGFGFKGVLAHARVQDFDIDGKKMLFIEEIQSDWHNEGAEKGYLTSDLQSKIDELGAKADELFFKVEDYSTKVTGLAGEWETIEKTPEGAKLIREFREADRAYKKAMDTEIHGVEDAPFHNTYHEYVLKRLLRMAAEEGYDSVGWTTAKTQDERWADNQAHEEGKGESGNLIGYTIEYDQDIPKFLRKYGKKWGAQVGHSVLEDTINGQYVYTDKNTGAVYTVEELFKKAEQIVETKYNEPVSKDDIEIGVTGAVFVETEKHNTYIAMEVSSSMGTKVWSMDIPDSMKDSVLYEGQVKFQKKKASNREILADALESVAQNDIERNKLAQYKEKIALIESEQTKLSEIRAKIKDLSFAKGPRDTEAIKKLQFEANQTANRINTYDRQLLNLESTAALKGVLQREKELARRKEAQKGKEALNAYREKVAKTQRELLTRYKDQAKIQRAKVTETRDKGEAREKLQKLILKTIKWLSYPNKEDVKCPDILKEPYAEFLKSIDLSSKRLLNGGDPTQNDLRLASAMDSLATAIEKVKTAQNPNITTEQILDSGYLDLPENFVENLRTMAEDIKKMMASGNPVVNDMHSSDVRAITKLIRTLNHAIKEMSTLYANLRFANVQELGDNSISFLESMGEAKSTNGVKDFVEWDNALPYYAFKRFGAGGESIFEGLMDAQDKLARLAKVIFDFKDKTWTDKEAKAWGEDTHTITLPSGHTLTLTTADAMSIYCLSRRDNNHGMNHLLGGGVRVIGIKKGTKKASDSRSTLTQEDVTAIVSSLTDKQKTVAEAIQSFMSSVCSDWGNEISMKRFLTREFNEKFYFPIESNDENLDTKDPKAQQSDLYRLLNISATKPLTPGANNEVIIRNIFDVFTNHASDMARLNSFGMALLDYMKWLNYREKSINEENGQIKVRGVRKSMERAYGEKAKSYVINLIKDINGRHNDNGDNSFLMNMMRMQKTANVGNNLRVAFLQFTSYPRASLVLSTGSLAKGLTRVPRIEKAKKYCGIALWKSFGFYDTNIARSIEDQIKGATNIRQKIIELSMKAPELADAITWGALWNACEYEVAKTTKNKVGSEEFYQEVGAKLRDVVYATQVVDSVLTRSQIMRSKSGLTQTATAYMSEPTLTANILMDASFQFQKEKSITGSYRTAWKKTGKIVGRAVANYCVLQLLTSLAESLADAWRDDDDEEFGEKFLEAFKENLITNIVPFNKLPIISDIADLILSRFGIGFVSSDNMATSWITQAADALDVWSEVLGEEFGGEETSKTIYNAIYKTAKAISSLTGVSVSGAMREVVTLWNNTAGAYDSTLKIRTYEPTNAELGQELYEAIVEGDDRQTESLEAQFDDQKAIDFAIRKALRENDPRIKEAAQADVDGDVSEYHRIVDEILDEGYFSEENIKAAIKSEVDDLTEDEEDTSSEPKKQSIYEERHYYQAVSDGKSSLASEIKKDIIDTAIANGKTRDEAEESFETSFRTYVGKKYKGGEASRSETSNMLTKYGGYDSNETYWKLKEWDFDIEHGEDAKYSKYDSFYEAVKTGRNLKAVIKEYADHGVKAETLASQVTSYYKPLYKNMSNRERASIKGYLLNAYEQLGYNRLKKSKDIDKWLED